MGRRFQETCRRLTDYFVIPLVATVLFGIFMIPAVHRWFEEQIPDTLIRTFTILLLFFTIVYMVERLVPPLEGRVERLVPPLEGRVERLVPPLEGRVERLGS